MMGRTTGSCHKLCIDSAISGRIKGDAVVRLYSMIRAACSWSTCKVEKRGEAVGTYPILGHLAVNLEFSHLEDNGFRRVDEVLVDDGSVSEEFVTGEAVLVDDLHLLDDSGLA